MSRELKRMDEIQAGDYIYDTVYQTAEVVTNTMKFQNGQVRYCARNERNSIMTIPYPPDRCELVLSADEPEVIQLLTIIGKGPR